MAKRVTKQKIHYDRVSGFHSATYGAKIVATLAKILQDPKELATMLVGNKKLLPM
jgi:hypothetical protein